MDELKDKFKNLLSRASNTANKLGSKKFEGQGNRLGTAEEHGVKPKVQGQGVVAQSTAASSSSTPHRTQQQQQQQRVTAPSAAAAVAAPQPAPPASQRLQSATEFNPFTAVIGSGAALSSQVTVEAPAESAAAAAGVTSPQPAAPHPPAAGSAHNRPSRSGSGVSSIRATSPQAPVTAEQVEQLQVCLAIINSQPAFAGTSMQVLSKLLNNLAAAPQEAKYRHIRLSNPKIQSSVVQVAGALELLAAVGFEVHAAAQPGSSSSKSPAAAAADDEDDGFAVFLDDSCLDGVQEGLKQLQRALPAALAAQQQYESRHQPAVQPPPPVAASQAGSAAATPSPAAAAPAAASPAALSVPRETQVLLPAVPDTEVPDWFFERTGAEVKAEYLAKMRQRQAGETFASKSWRDAQLGRGKGQTAPTAATVRVRFPEGVCLQGRFHVSEPLTALFEFVTAALRDPSITYQLVGPSRGALPLTGRIGDADLAPAVLLNFRPLSRGQLVDAAGLQQSFLRDELLRQAHAD